MKQKTLSGNLDALESWNNCLLVMALSLLCLGVTILLLGSRNPETSEPHPVAVSQGR